MLSFRAESWIQGYNRIKVHETSEGKRKSRVCRQHFQDHSLSTVSLAVLAGWVHGQISFGAALSVEKSGGMEPARGKGQTPANSSKPLSFGQSPQCPVFVSTPFHHKMRSIGYHRFTIPKSKSHPLAAFLHGLRDSTCSKQETIFLHCLKIWMPSGPAS